MTKMVTQSELARELNVSRQRVSAMVKQGLFTPNSSGKIDLDLALQRIAENRDESRGGVQPPSTETFNEARCRKERALASLRELEASEKKGTLVDVEGVRLELARVAVTLKTRLRSVPSAVAQEVFHLALNAKTERQGVAQIFTLLQKTIDEALLELSGTKI